MNTINESRIADYAILFYLARKLVKPIKDWDAYKLGLIDEDGKKIKDPKTSEEKSALSLIDRVILKIKYMIGSSRLRLLSSFILLRADTGDSIQASDLEMLSESERKRHIWKKRSANKLFNEFKKDVKSLGITDDGFWNMLLKNEIHQVGILKEDDELVNIGDLVRLTKSTDGNARYLSGSILKVVDNDYEIIDGEQYIIARGLGNQREPVVLSKDMFKIIY